MGITGADYDYPALKAARIGLEADVEALTAGVKNANAAGVELIAGNNAEGVVSTMTSSAEQNLALVKIAEETLEEIKKAEAVARQLHVGNGGEE